MKRTSRQLCNMSRRREEDGQRYIEGGGRRGGERERESTLVHFNGIYIKARQISSWVLDVRGSKKPFRHTAGFLIVKIDGELYSFSSVCGERKCTDKTMSSLFRLLTCVNRVAQIFVAFKYYLFPDSSLIKIHTACAVAFTLTQLPQLFASFCF